MTQSHTFGPYQTEQETADSPLVKEVRETAPRYAVTLKLSHLNEACRAAGVELGEYDGRIVAWLSGYEPATVQVLIGLITRAHAAEVADVRRVREIARRWRDCPWTSDDHKDLVVAVNLLDQLADLLLGGAR